MDRLFYVSAGFGVQWLFLKTILTWTLVEFLRGIGGMSEL